VWEESSLKRALEKGKDTMCLCRKGKKICGEDPIRSIGGKYPEKGLNRMQSIQNGAE